MDSDKCDQRCAKCNAPFVRLERVFAGLRREKGPLFRTILKYKTTYGCPRLRKPFAWFDRGHCKIEVSEEE